MATITKAEQECSVYCFDNTSKIKVIDIAIVVGDSTWSRKVRSVSIPVLLIPGDDLIRINNEI
jgi:hypothetical protein